AIGDFDGIVPEQRSELRINMTAKPKKVAAKVGNKRVALQEVNSKEALEAGSNVYYYEAAPNLNRFATKGSAFENEQLIKNPQLIVKLAAVDVREKQIELELAGYVYAPSDHYRKHTGALKPVEQ